MKTVPLKRLAAFRYGDALAASVRGDGDIPVVGSGGVSGTHCTANTTGPAIVVGRKGSFGSIHWLDSDCFVIDTAYSVHPLDNSTDIRWLYYALQAVDLKGFSQDVGVPGLSREAAYATEMPRPGDLEEQRRVAEFLDVETVRIDSLVDLCKRQRAAIRVRQQVCVEEALRECSSGEWTRVKYLLRSRPRYGVLVPVFTGDGVPFVRVNDLLDLPGRAGGLVRIPEELSKQYARTIIRPRDILLSVVGTLGRAAVVPDELVGANIARAVASIRLRPDISPSLFVAWATTSEFERQALLVTGSDSAQPTLGMEDLANFTVRWPADPREQENVARQVEAGQRGHLELIRRKDRQIALLIERRQALITAAVAGQFDVTTARPAHDRDL